MRKQIQKSKFYNKEYDNYDARSDEALEELRSLGLEIGGKGKAIEIEALIGFYQDDSGYGGNLDYAKSYSGYRADLLQITIKEAKKEALEELKKESFYNRFSKKERMEKIEESVKYNYKNADNWKTDIGSLEKFIILFKN